MKNYPQAHNELFRSIGMYAFEREMEWAEGVTESPIEASFLAALMVSSAHIFGWIVKRNVEGAGVRLFHNEDNLFFELRPQFDLAGYRIDFHVLCGNGKEIAVECDGREFHHATAKQIQRDRKRDADLIAAGVQEVVRIPGAQIHNSIDTAVGHVIRRAYWHELGLDIP